MIDKSRFVVFLAACLLIGPEALWSAEKKTAWYMEIDRLSMEDTLAITTLQGIANRNKPSLFVFTGDRHWVSTFKRDGLNHSAEVLKKYRNTDDAWKDYLEKHYHYEFRTLGSLGELVGEMRDQINGTVLYDNSECFHYVLALALASAYDLVPVTTDVLNRNPSLKAFPVKENLLNRYDDLLAAHKAIWQQANEQYTREAVYSIGAESHIYGIDIAVAQKMFVYRLSCDITKKPQEAAFVKEIISSLEPMSPAWGWGEPSESILRDLISEAGGFVMCSCVPNTSFFWKLKPLRENPFERRVPLEDFSQSELQDKYYISFMVNEGDTIKAAAALMSYGMWLEPQRGEVPINWGVCPWLYEHFPALMEYYYINASANDSFSPACSGYGYFTQHLSPDLDGFVRKEIPINARAGMTAGAGWGADKLNDKKPGLRDRWFDSRKMFGYINETAARASLEFTPENRPVINVDWKLFYWWHRFGKISEDEIYAKTVEYIEKLAQEHDPPFFIPIYGGMPSWFARLKTMLNQEEYEFVLMEKMMHLAKKAGQIQADPGHVLVEEGADQIDLNVTVRNMGERAYHGTVTWTLPPGWRSQPAKWEYPVLFEKTGNANCDIKVYLGADARAGDYTIRVSDDVTGRSDKIKVTIAEVTN